MPRTDSSKAKRPSRDPERTQRQILAAALKEFSAKGLAGARVDAIARNAGVNKRMLYHYFGNKDGLFSAVLRQKLSQREDLLTTAPDDPSSMLVHWFNAACNDPDWFRLLEWEALQPTEGKLVHEDERSAFARMGLERIRQRQAKGLLPAGLSPEHLLLSMMALTAYPWAFPQQTRLVTGHSVNDPGFQQERREFLKRFANVLRTGTAACCLLFVLTLLGCSRQPATPAAGGKPGKGGAGFPVPVLATQAVAKAMPVEVTGFGNVQAYSKVAVRSRITGELMKVHFQEGQDVKRGDLLFTIDPRPSEAALHQAQANLARDEAQADNARVEFDRNKKLFEASLISHDEFDKAESNLKALQAAVLSDQAAVSNAALNLEFTSIASPIDARTGNLLVHPGNIVQAGGDVLVTLNQIRPIYVTFSVPEQHFGDITRRMAETKLPVQAKLPSTTSADEGTDNSVLGELSFLDNSVDATTGMIQLKATFPNQDNALWPGQFLQVVLKLKEQANSIVVPAQAVQTGQTNDFVFVVKADQSVEMRPVKPGLSRGGETIVERGLSVGETVVTDGQLRLIPGVSKVNIRQGLAPVSTSAPTTAQTAAPKGI